MQPTASERGEIVYLGLGANLGDRLGNLRCALFALLTHPEIEVLAVSRLYESEYVGPGRQQPYLNGCAKIRTTLAPRVLLSVLKGTEERLGRRPGSHGAPRPIDLDIICYGQRTSQELGLTLPHPRASVRAFVLEPLGEIAPDLRFPDSDETVANVCAKIRRRKGPWIRIWRENALLPLVGPGGEDEWRAALAVHCR